MNHLGEEVRAALVTAADVGGLSARDACANAIPVLAELLAGVEPGRAAELS